MWLLLSPLNCLYLNPEVFSLLLSQFSPWSCRWGNEQLSGAWLLAGVESQHPVTGFTGDTLKAMNPVEWLQIALSGLDRSLVS